MSGADYLLLALVAGWSLFVLFRRRKSCCGSCENCGRCKYTHTQHGERK